MNISTTENVPGVLDIVLTISPEDCKKEYQNSLKGGLANASIPGFRKGKVPRDFFEKKYGNSILEDVILKKINRTLSNFISEENINPILNPMWVEDNLNELSYKEPTDINVKFTVALEPKITIPDGFSISIPERIFERDEATLTEITNDLLKRHGHKEKVERTFAGALIMGEIQRNKNGNWESIGYIDFSYRPFLSNDTKPESIQQLEDDKQAGFSIPFKLEDFGLSDYTFSQQFNLSRADLAEIKTQELLFTITAIEKQELPEITPEVQQKFFETPFDTEEKFLEALRNAVYNNYHSKFLEREQSKELEAIINALDVHLQEEEIEQLITATNKGKPITYAELISFLKRVRITAFTRALKIKFPDFEVTDELVKNELRRIYRIVYQQPTFDPNTPIQDVTEDTITELPISTEIDNTPDIQPAEEEIAAASEDLIDGQAIAIQEILEKSNEESISEFDNSDIPERSKDELHKTLINMIVESKVEQGMKDEKIREKASSKVFGDLFQQILLNNYIHKTGTQAITIAELVKD